jgi:ferric enterobactin receptor
MNNTREDVIVMWRCVRGHQIVRRLTKLLGLTAVTAVVGIASSAVSIEAQTRDLTGIVRDSLNNETLPSALVSLEGSNFRTLTDQFGRFTLVNVPDGRYVLHVEYLGYAPTDVTVEGVLNAPLDVFLSPEAIELDGVTVETGTDLVQVTGRVGQITISPRKLGTLPSLGETDVFRALQLLPGVGGTNDATSGLFVRGGTPDENLVLLDGMTVYHVDHFFGVFSAFNSDAIKDIRLYKGGFPAIFGGRTSSVVEMIGKSGDNENFNASGGMNLLSARAVTEVPLWGKGSWLLSARRSYTDILRTPLYNGIFNTLEGSEEATPVPAGPGGGGAGRGRGGFNQVAVQPSFYFFDINSKLTYTPTDSDVVALSVYAGEDKLDESSLGQQVTGQNGQIRTTPDRIDRSDWGNRGASGRWSRQWSSRFSTDALAAYSEYFSEASLDVAATQFARGFQEDNRVSDVTLRLDNGWRPFQSSDVGFGLEVTQSEVNYSFQQIQGDSVRNSLDLGGSGTLTSGYLQHVWTPSDRLDFTLGGRATAYGRTDEIYWEPRASAQVKITDQLSVKGAWGRYHQFVKRVENEDVLEGSRDFWVLAGDLIEPQSAEHRIAGATYERGDWLFDVEGYSKALDGVSQFSTRARTRPGQNLTELFFTGTGTARGLEVLAQRTRGALTGWVSYTLSNVEYELGGFNDGNPFPASHDQRHELKTVASYQLGAWTLSSTWTFGSGKPYTVPEAQYPIELLDGRTLTYIHVGEKNGQRLPAYHRMDVSGTRRFETASYFYELNLSLFNAYGRNNIWYRQFDLSELPMVVTDVTTLGFTPSIGLRVGLR